MSDNIPRPISRVYRGDPVEAKWANNIKAHIEAITGITDEVDNYYEKLQEAVDNLEIKVENIDVQDQVATYTQELAAAIEALNTELENSKKQLEEADKALTEDLMNGVAKVEARVDALPEEVKVIAHEVVANSVVVAPPNLVTNPTFKNNAQHWTINGNADLRFENDVVYAEGSSTRFYQSDDAKVPVEAGTSLKASIVYKGEWTGTWGLTVGCVYYTHEHEEISQDIQPVGRAPQDENWHSFSFISVVPENASYLSVRIGLGGSFIKGIVRNPRIVYATDASMIVEGSISADHIRFELGEVTGELTANRIKGGSLDFENIEVKNFRGENIEGGKIKADLIQANTFTHLGTSLLGNIPGTTDPQWLEIVGPYNVDNAPSPYTGRCLAGTTSEIPEYTPVNISQNGKYRAEVWYQENTASSLWLTISFRNLTPGAPEEYIEQVINTPYDPTVVKNGWVKHYVTFEFPTNWETVGLHSLKGSLNADIVFSGLEVKEDYAHQEDLVAKHREQLENLDENQKSIDKEVRDLKEYVESLEKRLLDTENIDTGLKGAGVITGGNFYTQTKTSPLSINPVTGRLDNKSSQTVDLFSVCDVDNKGTLAFVRDLVKPGESVYLGKSALMVWADPTVSVEKVEERLQSAPGELMYNLGHNPTLQTLPIMFAYTIPTQFKAANPHVLKAQVSIPNVNRGSLYWFVLCLVGHDGSITILDEYRSNTLGPLTPLGDGRATIILRNRKGVTNFAGYKSLELRGGVGASYDHIRELRNSETFMEYRLDGVL